MKIRKGNRKYAVLLNARTRVCYLTRANSDFDLKYKSHYPINSFECEFREAVHNLKVAESKGYSIVKTIN